MIIMLMGAGAGSRFVRDGHTVPKPFIPVNENASTYDHVSCMYEYVARKLGLGFVGSSHLVSFVTQSAFRKHVERSHCDWLETIYVPDLVNAGPVWSAVAATLSWRGSDSLLLLDSDCFVRMNNGKSQLDAIRQHAVLKETDAVVYTITAQHDTPDAATVSRKGTVRITEGGVAAGDMINVGAYWFRSIDLFRFAVYDAQQECGSKELKLSDVINTQIEAESYELDGTFVNLGTPSLLAAYQKEQGYVKAS